MKSKFTACLAVAFIIAGCASQMASAPYRPQKGGSQWIIDGRIGPAYFGSFYINGELAVEGQMQINSGKFLRGTYMNHPVSVSCKHTKNVFSTQDDCDVFVDQELAARLHFSK